ncbi:MAG TPA: hypothetical protein VGY53_03930 [Isosphaeraceae bacterium]|nr:hypothetical protein [Isosphaeraceae bacterium]
MSGSNGSLPRSNRLPALRRFAVAITVLNVLGHFVLGFEQSWAQPLVALAVAYSVEILLEAVGAWSERRTPQYVGGFRTFVAFLLPAHITALAVSMLLYASDRLWPFAFGAALGVASKAIVRVPVGNGWRHCLNPSNTGIALTLLLFPSVSISPPYQFTENLVGMGDWALPGLIVLSGTFLNTRFTYKVPLILGWLGGFVIQAVVRSQLVGTGLSAALLPMTGMAFLLFTFYMVTDPATTPVGGWSQFAFGVSVAVAYTALVASHVVFGLFFALLAVCMVRGVGLWIWHELERKAPATAPAVPAVHVGVAKPAALEVAQR